MDFFRDWLEVAQEECKHYLILRARLCQLPIEDRDLGDGLAPLYYDYGSFSVKDRIWSDAILTADSLLHRLILEHCTHEARGVDVCSLLTIPRFRKGGDDESADLLEEIVLKDEIDHIRKGLKYFQMISPTSTPGEAVALFRSVQSRFYDDKGKGGYAVELREQAGFTSEYYV